LKFIECYIKTSLRQELHHGTLRHEDEEDHCCGENEDDCRNTSRLKSLRYWNVAYSGVHRIFQRRQRRRWRVNETNEEVAFGSLRLQLRDSARDCYSTLFKACTGTVSVKSGAMRTEKVTAPRAKQVTAATETHDKKHGD